MKRKGKNPLRAQNFGKPTYTYTSLYTNRRTYIQQYSMYMGNVYNMLTSYAIQIHKGVCESIIPVDL